MNNDFEKTALLAAQKAGAIMMRNFLSKKRSTFKSDKNIVTNVDKACEKAVFEVILRRHPSHSILSEESVPKNNNDKSPFKWIIDPLDGTTNYSRSLPFFAISIGLEIEGEMAVGAVGLPVYKQTFLASKGKGAFMNGRRIRVSREKNLDNAALATGFPYDVKFNPAPHFNLFREFCLGSLAVRRAGSAAMDLCYVACGKFDGFWEFRLRPWDVAAASLILTEAGGRLSNYAGKKFSVYGDQIVASNGLIHEQMLKLIKRHYSG